MAEKMLIVTKETQKRLISDIKDIICNPLIKQGIWYVHDETKILNGYAMIIGPSDTIYADGIFFFEFEFPVDYPYSPPKLSFRTYDSTTRFHPNLYRNGKVCLSLLNTWKGEQWTSCQTIRSILLTLITLFHNKPLLNEPGITELHKDFDNYNTIIEYKNYDVAILQMITHEKIPPVFSPFYTFIKKHYIKNIDNILKKIKQKNEKIEQNNIIISTGIYNMKYTINYKKLYSKMLEAKKTYLKLN